LGGTLRPGAVRALLKGLGVANEDVSGVLSFLGGNGFYGPAGYDPDDQAANRRGIEKGLAALQAEELPPMVPIQQPQPRR
jgi:hypothetical protein